MEPPLSAPGLSYLVLRGREAPELGESTVSDLRFDFMTSPESSQEFGEGPTVFVLRTQDVNRAEPGGQLLSMPSRKLFCPRSIRQPLERI